MMYVGIRVCGNSTAAVQSRWRNIDGEGGSRLLYLSV